MSGEHDWLPALVQALAAGEPAVLVTIAEAQGSTPRPAGTKILVGRERVVGTIGGGTLEHRAIEIAHAMLEGGEGGAQLREFPLGPALGQCCGGHVTLLFETQQRTDKPLALFGAGHVARALVPILEGLPFRVSWIDSRTGVFSQAPGGVACITAAEPAAEVAAMPPGTFYLVMTHSHDQDLTIVEAALLRGDAAYVGLIGSATKRARFVKRLQAAGADVSGLVCPIGLPGVGGKRPKEIAVAVAAQLLGLVGEMERSAPGVGITSADA